MVSLPPPPPPPPLRASAETCRGTAQGTLSRQAAVAAGLPAGCLAPWSLSRTRTGYLWAAGTPTPGGVYSVEPRGACPAFLWPRQVATQDHTRVFLSPGWQTGSPPRAGPAALQRGPGGHPDLPPGLPQQSGLPGVPAEVSRGREPPPPAAGRVGQEQFPHPRRAEVWPAPPVHLCATLCMRRGFPGLVTLLAVTASDWVAWHCLLLLEDLGREVKEESARDLGVRGTL